MPPVIDNNRCIACGKCVDVCPQDVFWDSQENQVPTVSYGEECWHCNACVLDCPEEGAIRLRIPLPAQICFR